MRKRGREEGKKASNVETKNADTAEIDVITIFTALRSHIDRVAVAT